MDSSCSLKIQQDLSEHEQISLFPVSKPDRVQRSRFPGNLEQWVVLMYLHLPRTDVYQQEGTLMYSFIHFLPFIKQIFVGYLLWYWALNLPLGKQSWMLSFFHNGSIPEFVNKSPLNEWYSRVIYMVLWGHQERSN